MKENNKTIVTETETFSVSLDDIENIFSDSDYLEHFDSINSLIPDEIELTSEIVKPKPILKQQRQLYK